LNISQAWGTLFTWVSEINRQLANNSLAPRSASVALAAWGKVDSVLGVGAQTETDVPAEVSCPGRGQASGAQIKDFKRADAIRDELKPRAGLSMTLPKARAQSVSEHPSYS